MPGVDPGETRRFLDLAGKHFQLAPDVLRAVHEESQGKGQSASELVIEKGVLDAVQVDVVNTLLRPHQALPDYEILNLLGRGGMGVVYRARQKSLDRIVAIKTVLLSQLADKGAVARLEQEARTVAKLRHPNIVTAYDFEKHGGRLFFVMELLEGEDLERLLARKGYLDEATTWGILRQAAAGLAQAAQLGVVHRDIKPANVFLVEPPAGFGMPPGLSMVKLTDFGLAFLSLDVAGGQTRLTGASTTLGTPVYMAPEQFERSDVDSRADIYALGATAYHMLSGRLPFAGQTVWKILEQKMAGRLAPPEPGAERLSPASQSLIAAMMAREPDHRIGNYQELLARIDGVLGNRPVAAAPESAHETPPPLLVPSDPGAPTKKMRPVKPPSRPRSQRRWAFLAVVVVGAVLAGGVVLWLNQPPARQVVPRLVPSGKTQPVYDGSTIRGWTLIEGQLTPAKDAEGGGVLSGRGIFRRPLPPWPNYRLSMGVDLQQASAVEVHFGLQPTRPGQEPRLVLRIAPEGVALGRRTGDRGPWQPVSEVLAFPRGGDPSSGPVYREVRVERHGSDWFAYFDRKLVGHATVAEGLELPEFRLVVEDSPALFDTLEVAELTEPRETNSEKQ